MKFWTYLRYKNVRFSCNILNLYFVILLYIFIVAVEVTMTSNFWGEGFPAPPPHPLHKTLYIKFCLVCTRIASLHSSKPSSFISNACLKSAGGYRCRTVGWRLEWWKEQLTTSPYSPQIQSSMPNYSDNYYKRVISQTSRGTPHCQITKYEKLPNETKPLATNLTELKPVLITTQWSESYIASH